MIKTVVLGPYSGDILSVAGNIRRGMAMACEAALAGFAVLPCWWDWALATRVSLPMEWFKNNTIAWMQVADAILLAPGWGESVGVKAELAIASEAGIPVFESVNELIEWREIKIMDEATFDLSEISKTDVWTCPCPDTKPLTREEMEMVIKVTHNVGVDKLMSVLDDPTQEEFDLLCDHMGVSSTLDDVVDIFDTRKESE